VGALLTGVFAQRALNGVADGLLFGNPRQLMIQAAAVAAAIIYSGTMSFVLLKVIGAVMPLRTDGVFDQDTFYALSRVAAHNSKDFPTPIPGTPGANAATAKKGLSTGALVGGGLAVAAVVGGILYAATRGKKSRRR
jgi:hypothetical protein